MHIIQKKSDISQYISQERLILQMSALQYDMEMMKKATCTEWPAFAPGKARNHCYWPERLWLSRLLLPALFCSIS
jgi:hypothetical protein